jgi:hypothetical protein
MPAHQPDSALPTFYLQRIRASLRSRWQRPILACMNILITALVVAHLQLVVRVYDSVGVSPADLDHARASVGAILASVGIESIWRPCHVSSCAGPVKPHEVALRVVRSTPGSAKDSLGFSVIDVSPGAGSLGTIYEDRVRALAAQAGVDEGELLGRAMAHEIGHMLIGTTDHSNLGLMRPVWLSSELRRGLPFDWAFSRREGARLRGRLAARTNPAPAGETILAAPVSGDIECLQ